MTMAMDATDVRVAMVPSATGVVQPAARVVIRARQNATLVMPRRRRNAAPAQVASVVTILCANTGMRRRRGGPAPHETPEGATSGVVNAMRCAARSAAGVSLAVASNAMRARGIRKMHVHGKTQRLAAASATWLGPTSTAGTATSASLASNGALP